MIQNVDCCSLKLSLTSSCWLFLLSEPFSESGWASPSKAEPVGVMPSLRGIVEIFIERSTSCGLRIQRPAGQRWEEELGYRGLSKSVRKGWVRTIGLQQRTRRTQRTKMCLWPLASVFAEKEQCAWHLCYTSLYCTAPSLKQPSTFRSFHSQGSGFWVGEVFALLTFFYFHMEHFWDDLMPGIPTKVLPCSMFFVLLNMGWKCVLTLWNVGCGSWWWRSRPWDSRCRSWPETPGTPGWCCKESSDWPGRGRHRWAYWDHSLWVKQKSTPEIRIRQLYQGWKNMKLNSFHVLMINNTHLLGRQALVQCHQ